MAEGLCGDDRRDAAHADGFAGIVELVEDALDVGVDGAVGAFVGEVAQVHGGAESSGEEDGVEIAGVAGGKWFDVASGDPGGFDEDVAAVRSGFAGEVVDDAGLVGVRREAVDLGSEAAEVDERADGFVDFAPIEDAAP